MSPVLSPSSLAASVAISVVNSQSTAGDRKPRHLGVEGHHIAPGTMATAFSNGQTMNKLILASLLRMPHI